MMGDLTFLIQLKTQQLTEVKCGIVDYKTISAVIRN